MRKAYSIPDELHARVRMAAACGANRIPKGALERFVVRALQRAVDDPRPGAGLPRLKLCAHCFAVNSTAAAKVLRSGTAPLAEYQTVPAVILPAEKTAAVELFSHLLVGDQETGAIAGLSGIPVPREGVEGLRAAFAAGASDQGSGNHEIKLGGSLSGVPQEPAADSRRPDSATAAVDTPALSRIDDFGHEVTPGLWVTGDSVFYLEFQPATILASGWSVLSAGKEPWHRQMVGYTAKAAPEGEERLVARRGNHMALNLLDLKRLGGDGGHYVSDRAVDAGLDFITERIDAGDQVLVHAGDGQSMAPGLALLWMWREGLLPSDAPLPAFVTLFASRGGIFLPNAGLAEYLRIKLGGRVRDQGSENRGQGSENRGQEGDQEEQNHE